MSGKRDRKRERGHRSTIDSSSRHPIPLTGATVVLLVVAALLFFGARALQIATSRSGPHHDIIASNGVALGGQPIDGIACGSLEQLAYHIHQHLTLYRNGQPVPVPSEIGIPGRENNAQCFYWIHVHNFTPDMIHVESPVRKTFHLGNFFDIWHATRNDAAPTGDQYVQELVAAARHHEVTVFLNGKRWRGSYRTVPLRDHGVITVEVGKPIVPPRPFSNWSSVG